MLVYFVFQLESQSSKRWKVCQKFLDFFENLIQSSLFPEMLERWYFFWGGWTTILEIRQIDVSEIKIFPFFKTLCVKCWVFYFLFYLGAFDTKSTQPWCERWCKASTSTRMENVLVPSRFPPALGFGENTEICWARYKTYVETWEKKLAQSFVPLFVWGESTDMSKKMLETTWYIYFYSAGRKEAIGRGIPATFGLKPRVLNFEGPFRGPASIDSFFGVLAG